MTFEMSERGFKHYAPIMDTYGREVRVYESSAAEEPHVWLSVDGEAAAHLSVDQARAVIVTLEAAISHHYQGGPLYAD